MIANVKFHVTRCHAVTLYKSVTLTLERRRLRNVIYLFGILLKFVEAILIG